MTKRSLIQQCKLNKIDYKEDKIEVDRVTLINKNGGETSFIIVNEGNVVVFQKNLLTYTQNLLQMVIDADK